MKPPARQRIIISPLLALAFGCAVLQGCAQRGHSDAPRLEDDGITESAVFIWLDNDCKGAIVIAIRSSMSGNDEETAAACTFIESSGNSATWKVDAVSRTGPNAFKIDATAGEHSLPIVVTLTDGWRHTRNSPATISIQGGERQVTASIGTINR